MIQQLNLEDSLTLALLVGTAGMLIILFLLVFALLAVRRGAKATEPLADALSQLGKSVQTLDQGQQQLTGGLRHVSEAQAIAQAKMVEVMERRLEEVQKNMGESLHGSSQRTTRSLTATEQGRIFYDGALAVLDAVESAEAGITDVTENPRGTLHIAAPLGIGRRLIAPHTPEFAAQYPLVDVRLPAGSYLLVLRAPGFEPLRCPALIERGRHWQIEAPDAFSPAPLRLMPEGALSPDEVLVSQGWFVSGGDDIKH